MKISGESIEIDLREAEKWLVNVYMREESYISFSNGSDDASSIRLLLSFQQMRELKEAIYNLEYENFLRTEKEIK